MLNIWIKFQNTITNAEKLLHAADELAQSGECNAEQINMEAGKLESKIREFLQRLEQRKNLLNLTVSFYTHTQEVSYSMLYLYMVLSTLYGH